MGGSLWDWRQGAGGHDHAWRARMRSESYAGSASAGHGATAPARRATEYAAAGKAGREKRTDGEAARTAHESSVRRG
jgi:hypothetical protein